MFRRQYDNDVATFSPDGRLFQVEYAMESVKQGSVALGLRSNTHVVLGALRRSVGSLSSYQKKAYKYGDHCGSVVSGLTADARILSRYLRNECLNHDFVYESKMPIHRLVTALSDKSQTHTMFAGHRPYGVGLLIAGVDSSGPRLYQTCPSGNYFEYIAQAMGARSQSAKTYLEENSGEFGDCSREDLITHAIKALKRQYLPRSLLMLLVRAYVSCQELKTSTSLQKKKFKSFLIEWRQKCPWSENSIDCKLSWR
ncbi:hypothetical protein GEMRC1_011979 [Eukaryota sp. GEM-RC1]